GHELLERRGDVAVGRHLNLTLGLRARAVTGPAGERIALRRRRGKREVGGRRLVERAGRPAGAGVAVGLDAAGAVDGDRQLGRRAGDEARAHGAVVLDLDGAGGPVSGAGAAPAEEQTGAGLLLDGERRAADDRHVAGR